MARLMLVVMLALALPSVARAEDPKKAAMKHLKEGDKLFKKGDYEGALIKYQKAFEAFPSAKIYFPMAQTEEQLGRYIDALTHYELLLSEAGEPIPEALRTETEAAVAAVEKKIVTIKFDVRPTGATITVDNVELGQAPLEKPVRLMPGAHTWSITKDGFMPVEKEMDLEAGMMIDETVQLEPEQAVAAVDDDQPKKPKKQRRDVSDPVGGKRTVLIGGIVVTSALVAAATVTGLIAMSKHDQFQDGELSMEDREAARETGKSMATTTDILLVSAAVAGGFTIYWYFGQYKPAARAAEHATGRTIVTPYATTDGGGIAVMGRF